MKKIILLSGFVMLFSAITIISCSKDLDQSNESAKLSISSVVSPDGFKVAVNQDELKKMVFKKEEINDVKITSTEFLKIDNQNGAVLFINYNYKGESKNLAMSIGQVKTKFKSGSVKYEKLNSILKDDGSTNRVATYRCVDAGCCYVGGELDLETNTSTFYCKCEGNSGQNSSCTLTVTEN